MALTAQQLEQQKQLAERIRDYLRRADERLRRGMLVEPAEDNARFLIESARALAPHESEIAPRLYEDSQGINRGLFFVPR